ncbi:class III signal peptide-containing protein [Candidatus Micrarchaeota archaeon]|nr:class III signal peptide-containing protein [Candidatus Micrarchaeota archaeon]
MKKGQGAFEYILLLAGIIAISTVAFFILRGTTSKQGMSVEFSQCKSQLINVNPCYYSNGTWKPDGVTIYKTAAFGIDPKCTSDAGGGLAGSTWDVVGSEDEFKCGDIAPQ